MELNIDGSNLIAGRLGTFVAKRALLGYSVNILNAEKVVICGPKTYVFGKYHHNINVRGRPEKGPFISRLPDRFLRRLIRGMLPYKQGRGADAYKRVMCYVGVPLEFKDKKLVSVEFADVKKVKFADVHYLGDLCVALGGRR